MIRMALSARHLLHQRGQVVAIGLRTAIGLGWAWCIACSSNSATRDAPDQVGSGGAAAGSSGVGSSGSTASAGALNPDWGALRLAAHQAGKLFGAAANAEAMRGDASYATLLGQEFNYVTPENAMKWEPLAPSATSYSFDDADSIVEFATSQGQAIKGHTLVWHRQLPASVSDSMSTDELRAALKNHIETLLSRYRGRVRAWDVVNEAIDATTTSGYTDSVFYRKLGPGYIEEAFRMARAADPDVLLHYNEVGIERTGPKSDLAYALMKDLLSKSVPIDGIGLQSHITMHRYPSETHLRTTIRRFADLGLKVHISELDVQTLRVPGDQTSRWQAQRVPFQQIVGICMDEPACEGVTLWGVSDKYAWNADQSVTDQPLIFDAQFTKKPAYEGVLAGLGGQLPMYGPNLVAEGTFQNTGAAWDTTGSATLAIAAATPRQGQAACVSGRAASSDGLTQNLLQALAPGGQYAFSAWVRLRGAASGPVDFSVTPRMQGVTPDVASLGTITASDGNWVELSGNFGLGAAGSAIAIELKLYGPPANVDLCVADISIRAMTPE